MRLAVLLWAALVWPTHAAAQTGPTHIVLEAWAVGAGAPQATQRDPLVGHCDAAETTVTRPAAVVDDPATPGRVCWWPLMALPDGSYTAKAFYEWSCSGTPCNSTRVESAPFTVTGGTTPPPPPPPPPPPQTNTAPVLSITSPASGATFAVGAAVMFTASVVDVEDGNLSYRTSWAENVVPLGIGASVSRVFTVAGPHSVIATVNDNHGVVVTKSVEITVGFTPPPPPPPPPVEPPPPPPPPPPVPEGCWYAAVGATTPPVLRPYGSVLNGVNSGTGSEVRIQQLRAWGWRVEWSAVSLTQVRILGWCLK